MSLEAPTFEPCNVNLLSYLIYLRPLNWKILISNSHSHIRRLTFTTKTNLVSHKLRPSVFFYGNNV